MKNLSLTDRDAALRAYPNASVDGGIRSNDVVEQVMLVPTHTLSLSHSPSLSHSLSLSHAHSLSHTLSLSHTHTQTHTQHSLFHTLSLSHSHQANTRVPGTQRRWGGSHSNINITATGSTTSERESQCVCVCVCANERVWESVFPTFDSPRTPR